MITQNTALFTIFGATGDLLTANCIRHYFAYTKKDSSRIICRYRNSETRMVWRPFQEAVLDSIKDLIEDKEDAISFRCSFLLYRTQRQWRGTLHQVEGLVRIFDAKYSLSGNRIFYLAMSPEFFGTIFRKTERTEVTYARRVQPSDHRETFSGGFRICGCIETRSCASRFWWKSNLPYRSLFG